MLSVVLIVPAAVVDQANALSETMGWGSPSYTVPLTTGGEVTHWGLHTWAQPSFVDLVQSAAGGEKPEALAKYPDAAFRAVMAALIMSVRADNDGHFAAVCAEHGLVRWEEKA